jgi:hypothetical protein
MISRLAAHGDRDCSWSLAILFRFFEVAVSAVSVTNLVEKFLSIVLKKQVLT